MFPKVDTHRPSQLISTISLGFSENKIRKLWNSIGKKFENKIAGKYQ